METTADERTGGATLALARAVAFLVDATIAFGLVLVWRLATVHGMLPAFGAWRPASAAGWFDTQGLALAVLALVLRDVPTGASFAKWLLCLRVVGPDGKPLPRARRWQRAVSQFFPFTSWRRHRRAAAPWSVVAYTPSTLGLGVRALLTVGAAVWSLVFGFQTLRPSIGRSDAEHLAAATIVSDPRLGAELGVPLTFKVREIAPRSRLSLDPRSGEFELQVRGTHQRQDMVVHAIKVDGRWMVDEIVNIRVAALDAAPGDTVAVR
jgi:hypothetical protein